MAYPTKKTNHVAEGLGWFTSRFRNLPNMTAIAKSYLNRIQDLENVVWDIINSQQLAQSPTGQALNQLGDMVQEMRGLLNDVQYLLWIQVAIRAHKSAGATEDILAICQLALGFNAFTYTDWDPNAFDVYAPAMATQLYAPPLGLALTIARNPGTYGVLDWYDAPSFTLPILSFSDAVSHTGGAGFADVISGLGKAVPISAIALK